jgi:hypothetical protein
MQDYHNNLCSGHQLISGKEEDQKKHIDQSSEKAQPWVFQICKKLNTWKCNSQIEELWFLLCAPPMTLEKPDKYLSYFSSL